jgi:protein gp37
VNKTKIEWATHSWNPIKGICPEGCWYCYARAIYRRFKLDERLEFHVTRGEIAKMDRLPPSRIFVCSTMEMFAPSVETTWRDKIFQTIEMFPKHTFIILTKRPERIDRPMPPNVWLGVSVTGDKDSWRIAELKKKKARVRFVSLEPFLGFFPKDTKWIDWFLVGRLTGHGNRRNPARAILEAIQFGLQMHGVPLFMKNNLSGIWSGPLIQEYPKAMNDRRKP